MNVLIIGSGGREHAIVKAIKSSPLLTNLYLYKPNFGFKFSGKELIAETQQELVNLALKNNINLAIIGPEQYLADGIVDLFEAVGIRCIGANKEWAQLECSKCFAKEFMAKNNISTAEFKVVTSENQIELILTDKQYPLVIKADGLCGGKGVSIVNSYQEAKQCITELLQGKFGKASQKVLIEEYLEGDEISIMSLWDGNELLSFVPARDFKRINSNNDSQNTGGMGAFCPVNLDKTSNIELKHYLDTLKTALRNEKAEFTGFIYSGLILTNSGIKVLEYNMRLGDPETQVLLSHLENDFLELLIRAVNQDLQNYSLKWKKGYSACVVIASIGYPEKSLENFEEINLNEEILAKNNLNLFVANCVEQNQKPVTNGGRVLNICATSQTPFDDIYNCIEGLEFFKSQYYREDLTI